MDLELNKDTLRKVAGSFATGVAVVTCRSRDDSIEGITVNSFVSVSLEPPLILFSIQRQAAFLLHLFIGQPIGISILSEHQKSVSDYFAGLNNEEGLIGFEMFGEVEVVKDALAYYHLEVDQIIRAGDHDLIICEVRGLSYRDGNPLLYFKGYKSIGTQVSD
ncbi:MAG: flavin reductase family protein [Saprospiraceae bacterium]|nr:flavin reductase family protein [Bacteroidia bacterium]NNF22909.1 flavin reductase family protein [Saprospiraceae bacterium]NNK90309.1 flavin reductase family protein [Saprospiraceae bacterium]